MARRKRRVNVTRVMSDIRKARREFIREISAKLSDALGFPVRVTPITVKPEPLSLDMRRARRLPRKEAMRQVQDAFAPMRGDLEPIDKSGLTGL